MNKYQNVKVQQVIWIRSIINKVLFSSVQSLSRVRLFATPWIAARQASLSITNSRSSPRLTSIESVMPSSRCHYSAHNFNVNDSNISLLSNTFVIYFYVISFVSCFTCYLVQFSHSVVSDSLRPHEPQHARPPYPSPTPRVYPNSCPLSQWCI